MSRCDFTSPDGTHLPVVCGECGGMYDTTINGRVYVSAPHQSNPMPDHPFRPVHRIPDPEGIEGTAVVPCGE